MKPVPRHIIQHICSFDAVGKPEPEGSLRAYVRGGRAVVIHDNRNLRAWREVVGWSAREAMSGQALVERPHEVYMHLTFRLLRPPSLPKRRVCPTVKPDHDKLLRACLDALIGVVYHDDAQVVGSRVNKRYCEPGEQPGVAIEVWGGRDVLDKTAD